MNNIVLIDESIKAMDKACVRYVYGHVITNQEVIDEFEIWVRENVEYDTLRFSLTDKMHFTSLSQIQRNILVEKISKLPITFKVYVTYVNKAAIRDATELKIGLLGNSIHHHEQNKPNSKYIVEQAQEYGDLTIKFSGLNTVTIPFSERKALLLPDILLGVFCGFLDTENKSPADSREYEVWHTLIFNQIRLEVIDFQPKKRRYLRRSNKIV